MQGKFFVPIHWGTFNLAYHAWDEPADRVVAAAQSAGVPCERVLIDAAGVRLGESAAAEARQWEADLIVVGTHGRRGIGRVLLGSGAEQVIRMAPVPVLVIRGNEAPAG